MCQFQLKGLYWHDCIQHNVVTIYHSRHLNQNPEICSTVLLPQMHLLEKRVHECNYFDIQYFCFTFSLHTPQIHDLSFFITASERSEAFHQGGFATVFKITEVQKKYCLLMTKSKSEHHTTDFKALDHFSSKAFVRSFLNHLELWGLNVRISSKCWWNCHLFHFCVFACFPLFSC